MLVAVSGGKDSLSCADVLNRMRIDYGFKMALLHIDVGIPECTNLRTENVVRVFSERREIPYYFLKFKDFLEVEGNLEELFRKSRRPLCSTCGMLKRYILNKFARENGFNKIATGHCADDVVRFFFKNWFSQNFDWIAKFKPFTPSNHPKAVARIRPLFESLEAENLAYVSFNNITVAGCSRCSYFLRKDRWNELLKLLDQKRRDFKINLVRGLEEVEIRGKEENLALLECEQCGELTSQQVCAVCRLKMRLKEKVVSK